VCHLCVCVSVFVALCCEIKSILHKRTSGEFIEANFHFTDKAFLYKFFLYIHVYFTTSGRQ